MSRLHPLIIRLIRTCHTQQLRALNTSQVIVKVEKLKNLFPPFCYSGKVAGVCSPRFGFGFDLQTGGFPTESLKGKHELEPVNE